MSKTTIYTALVVASIAHDGYRRAGLGFKKGDNTFANQPLTDAQLVAIEADPRLSIKKAEAQSADAAPGGTVDASGVGTVTGVVGGVVTTNGEHKELADMKVPELRDLAETLDIEGAKSLKKEDLIKAIIAVEVTAKAEDDVNEDEQGQDA